MTHTHTHTYTHALQHAATHSGKEASCIYIYIHVQNMLKCVAAFFKCRSVCCRVLQGVAGCCRVLQGVAVHSVQNVLQCVTVFSKSRTMCCIVLQRVAACCSVLLCVLQCLQDTRPFTIQPRCIVSYLVMSLFIRATYN